MSEADIKIVSSRIDEEAEKLDALSLEIWKKPELRMQEVFAHSILTQTLESYGFQVQRNYILETAFRAEFSRGEGPTVAVICEYDALPDIGHACGHNLIAESGVAAGIAIKTVFERDPSLLGKIVVLGTPAEECGAGKVRLIEGGAFKDIDAALMIHPAPVNFAAAPFLCINRLTATYRGLEAHAAATPWNGRNALDAVVAAYVNVGLLRQQLKPECRLHTIITNGGTATNVIPAEAAMEMCLRAPNLADLEDLKSKVRHCLDSSALATGCKLELEFDDAAAYLNIISNRVLIKLYREYAKKFGIEFVDDNVEIVNRLRNEISGGSSDMGNVSYEVPSIHPCYFIGKHVNHTKDFTAASNTDQAHRLTRENAKAMALTALRLMRSPDVLDQVKAAFQKELAFHKEH